MRKRSSPWLALRLNLPKEFPLCVGLGERPGDRIRSKLRRSSALTRKKILLVGLHDTLSMSMDVLRSAALPSMETTRATTSETQGAMGLTLDPWAFTGAQPFTAGTVARTWFASERAAAFGLVQPGIRSFPTSATNGTV